VTDVAAPGLDLERQLEAHRPELTGYCYRMLGSAFEAEDAVQETMVRAWRGFDRFEGRSALRSWLYRIATNVCLDMLAGTKRRAMPMDLASPFPVDAPLGPPLPERTWIQPMPDARVLPADADPAEVAVAREGIRLAFVAALQHLPPRQRAVLILRDVLRWRSNEVAALLETTDVSVKSALQRARATLAAADLTAGDGLDLADDEQRALLARYVDAFERFDIEALVALLHEDATLSMPPHEFWLRGRDAISGWFANADGECRVKRLLPVSANGSVAFGSYRPMEPGGRFEAFAIQVVETVGDRIVALHAFLDPQLFRLFGLPTTAETRRSATR
jgi:RNA polymerase sigma-70 factor, ECF subfamily